MEPIDPTDATDATEPSTMDRRRFVRVLAVGGAAVLAGGVSAASAAAPKAVAPKPRKPIPPNVQKELRAQESNLAEVLRVIRAYDLPPGSEPATLFRAMRARRGVR